LYAADGVDRMKLPAPVPELPVSDVHVAGKFYARQMGFSVDWEYEDSLAGISRDDARLFLRRRTPEEARERYRVLVWLNMGSTAEVDQLHAEWSERGVLIVEDLRTTPYDLREFTAQDPDGNRFRVFYDMGSEVKPVSDGHS
jgi:predicted lactoylglutathione lyase